MNFFLVSLIKIAIVFGIFMTTLAYFSIDVNGDGSLNQSGAGWNGYQSQALTDLINRAHAAGDRVVLTVTCFAQTTLDQLTSSPTAPARKAISVSRSCQEARVLDQPTECRTQETPDSTIDICPSRQDDVDSV